MKKLIGKVFLVIVLAIISVILANLIDTYVIPLETVQAQADDPKAPALSPAWEVYLNVPSWATVYMCTLPDVQWCIDANAFIKTRVWPVENSLCANWKTWRSWGPDHVGWWYPVPAEDGVLCPGVPYNDWRPESDVTPELYMPTPFTVQAKAYGNNEPTYKYYWPWQLPNAMFHMPLVYKQYDGGGGQGE